jgi:hypothetical protein
MPISCQHQCSVEIENELLEQYDFEGTLISTENPEKGLLILSSRDSTFTLHIYQLRAHGLFEYHIEKELTAKTFATLKGLQYFLDAFSQSGSDEIIHFINKYSKVRI